MKRVARRGECDRYETLERQERIKNRYFDCFRRFADENVAIIQSEVDKMQTQAHIRAAVNRLFGW